VKVGNNQEGWSSPNSSFPSLCFHPICGLFDSFVVAIAMFVLCCRNEGEGFMRTIVGEHQESMSSFGPFFASLVYLSECVFICVYVAINIAQQ
jgi:hypothetical protein